MTHVEGDVNPVRDLEIISEELRLKDLEYLTKRVVSSVSGTVTLKSSTLGLALSNEIYTHILKFTSCIVAWI